MNAQPASFSNNAQRRFRRVPLHRGAEMEVHQPLDRPQGAVPVTIRSITCEGAGLSLPESFDVPLRRGDAVTVRFATHEHPMMEIPGRLAWYRDPRGGFTLDAGVQFDLLSAGPHTVGRFSHWVVDLITAVTNKELELGAILVRVANLPLRTLQEAIDRQRRTGQSLDAVLLEMRAVTDYDLRVAAHCSIHYHGRTVPTGLDKWKQRICAAVGVA